MKIFIYDQFSPEDVAMLQALYSRSGASVEEHVNKVKVSGSGNFMEKFYVGYGHASIADCGSTTIFAENVSMLVAKALQDWPLYSGQETSSRYIDMSAREIKDPAGTKESAEVLQKWMDFYVGEREAVATHLKGKYPRRADEDEKVYDKAIAARAFDILRGFLPAGVTTQLSWHTNLRQAHDKITLLKHHPLTEIREVAEGVYSQLKEKYSHSFSHQPGEAEEGYRKLLGEKYTYFLEKNYEGDFSFKTTIDGAELSRYSEVISKRPAKVGLPHFLSDLGQVSCEFLLDFGSFRDIQRHRNGVCRMPLLTTNYGFQKWYLDQLPEESRARAEELIAEQIVAIRNLGVTPEIAQYYTALGFNVSCQTTYALPAMEYVAELRSGRMVHPTLRTVAHQMVASLRQAFPDLVLHADLDLDDWDVRRGLQTIVEK